jgi:hypothetical protein
MSARNSEAHQRETLVRDLEDLIAALERRVPHIDSLGERAIARDADALKRKALARLEQLRQKA